MYKPGLYDEKGYEIRIDVENSEILLSYLGADIPEHEGLTYEEDPYVVSRLEFPFHSEWREQAVNGPHDPEESGIWLAAENTVYLKDTGIRKSGLRLSCYVPKLQASTEAKVRITVCGEQVKELSLEEGTFTLILDVASVGKAEQEYLERAHSILKILLTDFDRVCRKYGLRYYLICGSLLGAARHKELIPWDDDVDVAMPRRDFDILLEHAEEEWGKGKDIFFLNYNQMGNHSFLDFMTRIIYMKEEIPNNVFRKIKGKGRQDVENHLPMDIYVLDHASDKEWLHNFQTQLIRGLYGLAMGHRAYVNYEEYTNRSKEIQKIVKVLSMIGKRIPLSWIFGCYEWVRKWNREKNCENYFESNGFIFCIPWKFRQEWFGDGTRLLLGQKQVSAPQDYKAYLERFYGNYMQYPPMHARKPTHSEDASGIF